MRRTLMTRGRLWEQRGLEIWCKHKLRRMPMATRILWEQRCHLRRALMMRKRLWEQRGLKIWCKPKFSWRIATRRVLWEQR